MNLLTYFDEGFDIALINEIDEIEGLAKREGEVLEWQTQWSDMESQRQFRFSYDASGLTRALVLNVSVSKPTLETEECGYTASFEVANIEPSQLWHWRGYFESNPNRRFTGVFSSPLVADLDGDGNVEVVAVAASDTFITNRGAVAVIDGRSGEALWNSVEALSIQVGSYSSPALADLEGDGIVDIIAVQYDEDDDKAAYLFNYKASTFKKFDSETFNCGSSRCDPAVADIDNDGKFEVVVGNAILDHNFELQTYLEGAYVSGGGAALTTSPTLADLRPEVPGLEIIAQGQVWDATGKLLWSSNNGMGHLTATADLDGDGNAEIISVGYDSIARHNRNGSITWAQPIPRDDPSARVSGGAPIVADFTGNGKMDIGVASKDYYIALDHNGNTIWQTAIPNNVNLVGSTVFDINGDGNLEILFNALRRFYILDARTGNEVWSMANNSGIFAKGYPVIANIDDDPALEIVTGASTFGGVLAFEDVSNRWVGSRRIWNQYNYYPELIADNMNPTSHITHPEFGVRTNTPVGPRNGDEVILPELNLEPPLAVNADKLVFYVTNSGMASMTHTSTIKLFDGESNTLLKTTDVPANVPSGGWVKIEIPIDDSLVGVKAFKAELDTGGIAVKKECRLENNVVTFEIL